MYVHDELTEQIIGCAIEVHRALGPGLLELFGWPYRPPVPQCLGVSGRELKRVIL